jgi:hypothetical protein
MKVVAPSKKNEKNLPLLSMMFINRFEGSCGTFQEEKKSIVINDTGFVCFKKKKNCFFF